jgi:hypothetical protein
MRRNPPCRSKATRFPTARKWPRQTACAAGRSRRWFQPPAETEEETTCTQQTGSTRYFARPNEAGLILVRRRAGGGSGLPRRTSTRGRGMPTRGLSLIRGTAASFPRPREGEKRGGAHIPLFAWPPRIVLPGPVCPRARGPREIIKRPIFCEPPGWTGPGGGRRPFHVGRRRRSRAKVLQIPVPSRFEPSTSFSSTPTNLATRRSRSIFSSTPQSGSPLRSS